MDNFEALRNKLKKIIDFDCLDKIIISNPIKKGDGINNKVTITKITLKGKNGIQFSYYADTKVTHENIQILENKNKNERIYTFIIEKILSIMTDNFKQCNISANRTITILMNKKKEFKIVENKENKNCSKNRVSHNEAKNYIIKDGVYCQWLFEIDLIDKNGNVHNSMQKKFRQINRFLEMVADIEKYIPNNGLIIDMGCGKSYLTFAIYHYFNILKRKNVKIKGFDLKKDVVKNCNNIAKKSNFKNLEFFAGDIADITASEEKIDMIITLHACDTATDIAIAYGIKQNCKVIMSVPCCQHELFYQVKNDELKTILSYGILKERFSALLTDGIRGETLKLFGYKTSILEFIDMEHTPKNIMIRAVKKDFFKPEQKNIIEYNKLLKDFNVEPTIYKLLKNNLENSGF